MTQLTWFLKKWFSFDGQTKTTFFKSLGIQAKTLENQVVFTFLYLMTFQANQNVQNTNKNTSGEFIHHRSFKLAFCQNWGFFNLFLNDKIKRRLTLLACGSWFMHSWSKYQESEEIWGRCLESIDDGKIASINNLCKWSPIWKEDPVSDIGWNAPNHSSQGAQNWRIKHFSKFNLIFKLQMSKFWFIFTSHSREMKRWQLLKVIFLCL